MDKQIVAIYKVPFLTSITLFIVLLALGSVSELASILAVLLGALLGMLLLDLEYVVYAYFVEPEKDFSKSVVGFIKHKDFINFLKYINYHKAEIKEKSVNSGLFQTAFAIFAVFALSATTSYFLKALILSLYINLLYRAIEAYYEKKTDDWFWIFKSKPEPNNFMLYLVGLSALFIYCLTYF
jgi:hypothetical protein